MNPDFKELLKTFNEHAVKYLIVGGYAVMKYSEPRFTKDLDIWSSKRLLRVSFTVRADETEDEIIRIISARKGKAKEEKIYYEQNR